MMKEINHIRFNRSVVPPDAVSLEINTIDTADASQSIACAAIYVRYLRHNGTFSCQLIFARSKIIPEGTTQPRAELIAANLNAQTGFVVKRSFGNFHTSSVKLTDSQIALFWITNEKKPLKTWVRNRVININRFSSTDDWMYVRSEDMIADIGTRPGITISDVVPGSIWIEGFEWMKSDVSEFPTFRADTINLKEDGAKIVKKESYHEDSTDSLSFTTRKVSDEVISRYTFSNYIIDPVKRRFSQVIRILALVYRFIVNCRNSSRIKSNYQTIEGDTIILSNDELLDAKKYLWRKATLEVKEFANKNAYCKKSKEIDGILYYTGRILPNQKFTNTATMTDVMLYLTSSTFCVPIVDKYSPIAYSIINETHWYHPVAKHSGVETVLRYVTKQAFILEGREQVKIIRKNCERCRYLLKRTVEVFMGPVSNHNINIAPAFYVSQIDLAGPFLSYSPHNKRTTVKIWYLVVCCTTTSTINIKVMEDYSTSGFIQAFMRLSCEVGYPKIPLPDEGSQLVSRCKNMKISYQDLKGKLHKDMGISFEKCPVGGHLEDMHGKVERKIKQVKESIEKSNSKERLSILQWETLGSESANCINDLPLAIGDVKSDLENIDLITPNRLRLGRNNDRSPIGNVTITEKAGKFLEQNRRIFNVWFECWLISHVPKIMKQPKWFQNDANVKPGDIVLFLKAENLSGHYMYGMIVNVEIGKDERIRTVIVKHRNSNESTDRTTRRAVRELIVIHHVDELDIHTELYEASLKAELLRSKESIN